MTVESNPGDQDALGMDDVLVEVLKALPPITPPPTLRDRVLHSIAAESKLLTIRADAGGWRDVGPGVAIRVLHKDVAGCSFLLRLAAGATFPAHDHAGNEECILLEGDLTLDDVTIHAGDYHLAPRGARHGLIRSEHGALAFIRSANPAEYAA